MDKNVQVFFEEFIRCRESHQKDKAKNEGNIRVGPEITAKYQQLLRMGKESDNRLLIQKNTENIAIGFYKNQNNTNYSYGDFNIVSDAKVNILDYVKIIRNNNLNEDVRKELYDHRLFQTSFELNKIRTELIRNGIKREEATTFVLDEYKKLGPLGIDEEKEITKNMKKILESKKITKSSESSSEFADEYDLLLDKSIEKEQVMHIKTQVPKKEQTKKLEKKFLNEGQKHNPVEQAEVSFSEDEQRLLKIKEAFQEYLKDNTGKPLSGFLEKEDVGWLIDRAKQLRQQRMMQGAPTKNVNDHCKAESPVQIKSEEENNRLNKIETSYKNYLKDETKEPKKEDIAWLIDRVEEGIKQQKKMRAPSPGKTTKKRNEKKKHTNANEIGMTINGYPFLFSEVLTYLTKNI